MFAYIFNFTFFMFLDILDVTLTATQVKTSVNWRVDPSIILETFHLYDWSNNCVFSKIEQSR